MKYTGARTGILLDRLLKGLVADVDAESGRSERKVGLLVRKYATMATRREKMTKAPLWDLSSI